jgi:ABC-type dipeptide/oligopeptide/nickel transport system permease component
LGSRLLGSSISRALGFTAIFVIRRLAYAVASIVGVSAVTFFVTHVIANPVALVVGQNVTPGAIAALSHQFGYDRPVWEQYLTYMGALLHGNLGTSIITYQPVSEEILRRLPNTIELTAAGLLLGVLWTIPVGCLAALHPGGRIDRLSEGLVAFGVAMPGFWLGLLLILLLYFMLHLAPTPFGQLDPGVIPPPRVTGFMVVDGLIAGDLTVIQSSLAHLLLPALTLALTSCPAILQLTRDTMVKILRSDYIRSARSLGLPPRTVLWYALKNAIVPVVTATCMIFGWLLGSTVLVETVFAWPGIGLYAVQSIRSFDYSPILGIVLMTSTVYVVIYLVADLVGLSLDPRTRMQT